MSQCRANFYHCHAMYGRRLEAPLEMNEFQIHSWVSESLYTYSAILLVLIELHRS